jgi:hypothetical protein
MDAARERRWDVVEQAVAEIARREGKWWRSRIMRDVLDEIERER